MDFLQNEENEAKANAADFAIEAIDAEPVASFFDQEAIDAQNAAHENQ